MHFSKERPLTSRTRKRLEQLEDDEELARVIAMEEDEKIAAKLQRDFENGIENNDFHRVNSRGELVYFNTREEWESAAFNNQLEHSSKPELASSSGRPEAAKISNQENVSTSSELSPEQKRLSNAKYDHQRASFPPQKAADISSAQRERQETTEDDADEDDDEDSDLEDLAGRIQRHEEDMVPKVGMTRKLSNEFLLKKKIEKESNIEIATTTNTTELGYEDGGPTIDPGSIEKELKSIYEMIDMYQPETFELEHTLKPFLPDFIPCIGDIDPIIKVSMPPSINDKPLPANLKAHEYVGFVYIDEPSAQQSDPAVIDLALRAISLQETTNEANMKVRSIQLPSFAKNLDTNKTSAHKALQNWIDNVVDLQLKKNRPTGPGGKGASQVEELEKLMAEWPQEIDVALTQHTIQLPTADIDLSLNDFSKLCCAILDVPIKPVKSSYTGPRKQLIDSLSSIFSVYLLFKNSQHFSGRV